MKKDIEKALKEFLMDVRITGEERKKGIPIITFVYKEEDRAVLLKALPLPLADSQTEKKAGIFWYVGNIHVRKRQYPVTKRRNIWDSGNRNAWAEMRMPVQIRSKNLIRTETAGKAGIQKKIRNMRTTGKIRKRIPAINPQKEEGKGQPHSGCSPMPKTGSHRKNKRTAS